MNTTPVSLLERLREPDANDAWQRFADLYTPLLYYWAHRLGLKDQDAADLVQDVFAVLVEWMPRFRYDPDKSFRSWLRVTMLNKWRAKQRTPDPARGADQQDLAATVAVADPVEAYWEEEFRNHLVRRALELMQADFEERTWKACWELVVNERPAADVATELGLTVGAVHAAKSRVLARLREELNGMID